MSPPSGILFGAMDRKSNPPPLRQLRAGSFENRERCGSLNCGAARREKPRVSQPPGKLYLKKYCRHAGIILRRGSLFSMEGQEVVEKMAECAGSIKADLRDSNEVNISTDASNMSPREKAAIKPEGWGGTYISESDRQVHWVHVFLSRARGRGLVQWGFVGSPGYVSIASRC
jgi:hypothetical protein